MRTPITLVTLALATPSFCSSALADNCQGRFIPGPALNGTDDTVTALLTGTIPQGTKLFVGGRFHVAGDKVSDYVAAWNGTAWEAMGADLHCSDFSRPIIKGLLVFNNSLYACGRFETVNGTASGGLMRWTGLSWVPFTTGAPDNIVNGMLIFNNSLYVYGSFTTINGVAAKSIARWTGTTFEPVGPIDCNSIESAAVHNGQLVVTGWFIDIDGVPARMVARWNGSQWLACSEGLRHHGYSLASYNGILYNAGASDYDTPDPYIDGLNYWNGQYWSALTGGDALFVAARGGQLFAGGYGSIAGIEGRIAAFNGVQWQPLGDGVGSVGNTPGNLEDPFVRTVDIMNGQTFVGGEFTKAGGVGAQNIARWNGTDWSRLNTGQAASDSRPLYVQGHYQGNLVTGGYKKLCNNTAADRIMITADGSSFQPLSGEIIGGLRGFADYQGALYAYGSIESVDGQPIEGICRWNGTAWESVGDSVKTTNINAHGNVYDTAVFNGNLVCAGYFNQAGNIPANRIAAWNGSAWANLGAGTDQWISELEVHDGQLYAAGSFTVAGGVPCQGFARWDGAAWHAVNRGPMPAEPVDMLEYQGDLYATFENTVYRLVNDTWQVFSVMPPGQYRTVFLGQLFTYRGELATNGDFGDAPDYFQGTQIRVLHNGEWIAVHPGSFNGAVYDSTEFRGQLVSVGTFTAVDNTVSPNLARYAPEAPYIWDQPEAIDGPCPGSTVNYSLQSIGGPIQLYRWYRNNVSLNNGATGTGSTISGATTPSLQIQNISSSDDGIYTCTVTTSCGAATTDTVRLITGCTITPCGPADVGSQGGVPGADGQLDNNDFIVYIDFFFQQLAAADLGQQGGIPGSDGNWDNNDFIVFIDLFFAGCN